MEIKKLLFYLLVTVILSTIAFSITPPDNFDFKNKYNISNANYIYANHFMGDWNGSINYLLITDQRYNDTLFIASIGNLTYSQIAANIGNWSADKSSYLTIAGLDNTTIIRSYNFSNWVNASGLILNWSTIIGTGGNTSWNESYARGIFVTLTNSSYITINNFTNWVNASGLILNWSTIIGTGGNTSWNESYARTIFVTLDNSSYITIYNFTNWVNASGLILNWSTIIGTGGNVSFNQSLTDSLYVPYTGANNNVNLGNYGITASYVNTSNLTCTANADFTGEFSTPCLHCEDNVTYFHSNGIFEGNVTAPNIEVMESLIVHGNSSCSGVTAACNDAMFVGNPTLCGWTVNTGQRGCWWKWWTGTCEGTATTCETMPTSTCAQQHNCVLTSESGFTFGADGFIGNISFANNVYIGENLNVTGNITTSGWFKGIYDWIIGATSTNYLSFNGTQLDFNETILNATIGNIVTIANASLKDYVDTQDNTKYNVTGGAINGNVWINGNLTVIGDYIDANVTQQNINGSIIPQIDNVFNLGSPTNRWANLYAANMYNTTQIDSTFASIGNFSLENSTIARIGNCPDGYVVMNTTTSGVQCVIKIEPSTTYYPQTISVLGGANTTGNINLTYWYDLNTYNISEGTGALPVLDVYMNYTNVTDFSQWIIREEYLGSSSHHINFEIWDYTSSTWEDYFSVVGQTGQTWIVMPVYDTTDHISGGVVQTRLVHIENGIASHRLYIDVAWLVNGNNIGASTNLAGYAKYSFGYNSFSGNGNFTTTGNITANTFFGNWNGSVEYNTTNQNYAIFLNISDQRYNDTLLISSMPNLTLGQISANIGNWSADKSSYYTTTQVDTLGNWSADKSGYYKTTGGAITGDVVINGNLSVIGSYVTLNVTTQNMNGSIIPSIDSLFDLGSSSFKWANVYADNLDSMFSSMPNLTLVQIGNNLGNWSADKSGYYTSGQTDNIIATINNLSYSDIVNNIGNFSAWDKDYGDLINTPTHLSNFTDDLGNRGYTHLSNFTNDIDVINSTFANNTYVKKSGDTMAGNLNISTYNITSSGIGHISSNTTCIVIKGQTATLSIC